MPPPIYSYYINYKTWFPDLESNQGQQSLWEICFTTRAIRDLLLKTVPESTLEEVGSLAPPLQEHEAGFA